MRFYKLVVINLKFKKMFRIPLKIGKNNEIEEMSDIEGLTERRLSDRRSLGAISEQSIFEERMAG